MAFQQLIRVAAMREEQSVRLPQNSTVIRYENRSRSQPVRVAYETGLVADDGGTEIATRFIDGYLGPSTRTVYYAADVDGVILEIFVTHGAEGNGLGPGWGDDFGV